MLIVTIQTEDGKTIGAQTMPPKAFKTGSKGYFANGKVEIDGVRYQAQFQLVAIGSKGEVGPVVVGKDAEGKPTLSKAAEAAVKALNA